MASSGKPKTTMAKLQKEAVRRERRVEKAARKRIRKLGQLDPSQPAELDPEALDADALDADPTDSDALDTDAPDGAVEPTASEPVPGVSA